MVNAYLGKRSYYHSSSTMHSCKLWHYLCWHRGETWRREKKMKGENKERKVWHLGKHTHKLWPVVNEKNYARPPPVGPVRFISNIKGLSARLQPHPSVPCLGYLCGQSPGRRLGSTGPYQGVCVHVFLGRGGCLKQERLPGHTGPWHSPPSGIPGCNGSTSPR